ncbi:hypothetical protein PLICRDRAFT_174462 [Plicaturopsis crispa FD-325 SS-3]|nr:hypothetical protein PLICRDRAFT_174462 [Plicaturopsis crispa FD-325 SS-3]
MQNTFYRDHDGRVPRSVVSIIRNVQVVRLNDVYIDVPEAAIRLLAEPNPRSEGKIDPRTGSYKSREWGSTIDWHQDGAPWLGFIPTSSPRECEWYLSYGRRAPVQILRKTGDDAPEFQIHPPVPVPEL